MRAVRRQSQDGLQVGRPVRRRAAGSLSGSRRWTAPMATLRRLLVHRVRELRWRVTEAAEAAGVACQTVCKRLARYEAEGEAGLEDRSYRPHRVRRPTPRRLVQRMLQPPQGRRLGTPLADRAGRAAPQTLRAPLRWEPVPRRCQALRAHRRRRSCDPWRSPQTPPWSRLGGRVRLRRRLHPLGLRRGSPLRGRRLRNSVLSAGAAMVQPPGRALPACPDRQRQVLRIEDVYCPLCREPREPARPHRAIGKIPPIARLRASRQ